MKQNGIGIDNNLYYSDTLFVGTKVICTASVVIGVQQYM